MSVWRERFELRNHLFDLLSSRCHSAPPPTGRGRSRAQVQAVLPIITSNRLALALVSVAVSRFRRQQMQFQEVWSDRISDRRRTDLGLIPRLTYSLIGKLFPADQRVVPHWRTPADPRCSQSWRNHMYARQPADDTFRRAQCSPTMRQSNASCRSDMDESRANGTPESLLEAMRIQSTDHKAAARAAGIASTHGGQRPTGVMKRGYCCARSARLRHTRDDFGPKLQRPDWADVRSVETKPRLAHRWLYSGESG